MTTILLCTCAVFVLDKPGSNGGLHRWEGAKVGMGEIQKALITHWLDKGRYPESLDELVEESFPNGVPKNPYTKEPYDYFTTGERFVLICYGRDDQPGGEAPPDRDIVFIESGCLSE